MSSAFQPSENTEQRNAAYKALLSLTRLQQHQITDQQDRLDEQQAQIAELKHQLDWFKRQLFGEKSEKRLIDAPGQGDLLAGEALALIGELYRFEAEIREKDLSGLAKLEYRRDRSLPVVRKFWSWCAGQRERTDRVPSNPLAKAIGYVWARREALEVYLADPGVAIDTNHLERALRPIPMGRRNYLFYRTELGAKHVGIIQSLLVTCRLHGVHPYTYLVDVLQRVSQHPATQVIELTPCQRQLKFPHLGRSKFPHPSIVLGGQPADDVVSFLGRPGRRLLGSLVECSG